MKFKVFSILTVLCCAFVFAACSSSNSPQESEKVSEGNIESSILESSKEVSTQIYKDYEYIVENGGVTITKYNGNEPKMDLDIPEEINNTPVKIISESAFQDNVSFQGVTIPDSVTEIREKAFYNCSKLVGVDLDTRNSELSFVGNQAFGKTKVAMFSAPKNCRKIENAFYGSLEILYVWGKDTRIDSNVISTETKINAYKDSVVAEQFPKDKGYNLIELTDYSQQ